MMPMDAVVMMATVCDFPAKLHLIDFSKEHGVASDVGNCTDIVVISTIAPIRNL